jgi:hypothetical protein
MNFYKIGQQYKKTNGIKKAKQPDKQVEVLSRYNKNNNQKSSGYPEAGFPQEIGHNSFAYAPRIGLQDGKKEQKESKGENPIVIFDDEW